MTEVEVVASLAAAFLGIVFGIYKTLNSRIDNSRKYLEDRKVNRDIFEATVTRITNSLDKLESHIEKLSDRVDKQGELLAEIRTKLELVLNERQKE